MADNAAVAAAEQAQLNVEQAKLPLFHADKKLDQFTGDQWLERFEKSRVAGNWNQARTTSYFYNSLRGLALRWYRMISIAKVDVEDYDQLRQAFVENYGTQTSNKIVITDFNKLNQKKDEPVQEFFSRVGDVAYNYNQKKPNDDIRGPVPPVPEDEIEDNQAWLAVPAAQQMRAHMRSYRQFARNDISYLGLQFFVAGLHPDIQLEVIKSKTADLYEAFKIAHDYETALQKKEATVKINELDAIEDPEERAEIEAVKRQFQQKRMFNANNGSAYQTRNQNQGSSNSGNSSNQGNGNGGQSSSYQSGSGHNKRPNPAFGKICHYCKKKNHFQSDCHKRKRDNAPMVKVKEIGGQDDGQQQAFSQESIFYSKN
jgi:hypothetical protein